jgi:hypothetical protein
MTQIEKHKNPILSYLGEETNENQIIIALRFVGHR